jgi:hypothetical protein
MPSFLRTDSAPTGILHRLAAGVAVLLLAVQAVANDTPGFTSLPGPNTQLCSSTPPKCTEKSAEDIRYERIIEALKKMEGGERIYSRMATPANEPASYGPSQMVIELILEGLMAKGGAEFTFTAKNGMTYTLTQKDLQDAHNRGKAMFDKGSDLMKEAAKHNDYKTLTMPPRTKAADGFLTQSGIAKAEWDTWWTRAVAYQKLTNLGGELRKEYKSAPPPKDEKGKPMKKYDGNVPVMATFQKFVESKGTIPDTTISYWTRFTELLDLAFPHESNKLTAIRRYLWNGEKARWEEGRWSFYNRAAYSHPTIPYDAFKEGIAKWFDATPAAEESFIRNEIKAAAEHKDVNLSISVLHSDADEEKLARYFASLHNSGGFSAIFGDYANKFVEHWKKVKWNFKCGTDPRNPSTSEPEPKEAQA